MRITLLKLIMHAWWAYWSVIALINNRGNIIMTRFIVHTTDGSCSAIVWAESVHMAKSNFIYDNNLDLPNGLDDVECSAI